MDWKKLQNGSDIRGVALEGIEGEKDYLIKIALQYLKINNPTVLIPFGQWDYFVFALLR